MISYLNSKYNKNYEDGELMDEYIENVVEFLMEKFPENINYHYKEECSPIRLIEKIHEYDRRVKNENYDHV